jgi:hypothetical protein
MISLEWEALTLPIRPKFSKVSHTAAAIFSPECSPMSSRKSIRHSSAIKVKPREYEDRRKQTQFSVVSDVVNNDRHKGEAIAGRPCIQRDDEVRLVLLPEIIIRNYGQT